MQNKESKAKQEAYYTGISNKGKHESGARDLTCNEHHPRHNKQKQAVKAEAVLNQIHENFGIKNGGEKKCQ